jgi:fatty-acid peroxygenase
MSRSPSLGALDRAPLLSRHGYLFTAALPPDERRQLHERGAVLVPFLGRKTLIVGGSKGVEFFYDESLLERHKAVPAPVATSLFGPGAIHALDDEAHRHRKTLFLESLTQSALDRLLVIAERRWRDELSHAQARGQLHVFDSSVTVFGSSIIEWAGVHEPESQLRQHAQWMADIVHGFGVVGPAYLKAVRARKKCDAWAKELIRHERSHGSSFEDSWLARVASFADADGQPLDERTAAVELLNVLRPTVAVSWLASFAALALVEHPDWRHRIREEPGAPYGSAAQAFAHEVRRYYPFVPVLAARTRTDTEFVGLSLPAGHRVLLDVHGTDHGAEWRDPWSFDPSRFESTDPCALTHFVPQGGGPRETGHRCPGEGLANGLLALTVTLLARLPLLELPHQDSGFTLRRMPTRPASGPRLLTTTRGSDY